MGVNAAAAAHVGADPAMKPAFLRGGRPLLRRLQRRDRRGGPETQDFRVWDQWLQQIEPGARQTPWMTTVGNHEMEAGNGELGLRGLPRPVRAAGQRGRGGG